jgi:alpha-tubulin suppressor-like RCC1 family protein
MFAVTGTQELYGWGRNNEGQLGLGIISEYIHEPTMIRDLESISTAYCGDNYSACVSAYGEVYVTGSLEGGKLGQGNA